MAKLIAVKATGRGFAQGRIIEVDEEFYMPEGAKGSWFTPVVAVKPTARTKPAKAAKAEASDDADPEALDLA